MKTYRVTNNFDNTVFLMGGTLQEVKDEIKYDCRKNGRSINDYKIEKL